MEFLFWLSLILLAFGVCHYRKISYKANYIDNKENDTGYYWGGKPRG